MGWANPSSKKGRIWSPPRPVHGFDSGKKSGAPLGGRSERDERVQGEAREQSYS